MTTTTARCAQPGCDGTIQDGYCDTCGLAAPAASSGPSGPSGPSGSGFGRLRRVRVFWFPGHTLPVPGPWEQPVGTGQARRGPGRHTAGPVPGSGQRRAHRPAGAGGQTLLQQLRSARRAGPRRASRPRRRILPELRHPVLVQPEARAGRPGRRPVRGTRLPRPRRARLDLPRPGPQRQRPVGGAEGPAGHRRRRRHGRRRRRAAVPGRGRAPQHRPDLQLRPACGPAYGRDGRLHRDGVRGRQVAQADPGRRASGRRFRACRPCAGLRHRGPARTRLPARPGDGVLRLQAGQRHPDRRTAQAHRHGRRAPDRQRRSDLRDGRLPGPGDRGRRALAQLGPVYGGPGTGRAHLRVPRLPGHVQVQPARRGAAARRAGVVRPAAAAGHPHRTRPAVRHRGRDGRAAHRRAPRGARGRRPGTAPVLLHPVQPRSPGGDSSGGRSPPDPP